MKTTSRTLQIKCKNTRSSGKQLGIRVADLFSPENPEFVPKKAR